MNVPNAPAEASSAPNPLITMLNNGHTKNITMAKNGIVTTIIIGTNLLPPKKLNAVGSCVSWKRL